jgi:cellulose synthase/poly-beta-1,6-N-acetylglucosamine synthase-like glycosyltransferase
LLDLLVGCSAGGLVSVWLGYPAAMGLLARLTRARPRVPHAVLPSVSVVLATRESAAAIRARVENCRATTYPADKLEVVVALDRDRVAADDDVAPTVVMVRGDAAGGKASALNAALRSARGDVVVFTDTHQRFDERTIPNLVAALADARVGAVSGRLELGKGAGVAVRAYWSLERWLRHCEAQVHSCVGVTGAVYAIRRKLWAPLPSGLINDDVFIPMRIVLDGHRVAFAEDAHAFETRRPTPLQEYTRKLRTLTGVMQLCAWMPALLVPLRNPIWAQFVIHKLLRLLTPYLLLVIAFWCALQAGAILGPYITPALVLLALTMLWMWRTKNRWGSAARRVITECVLLQVAIVLATANALRGRWQVWDVGPGRTVIKPGEWRRI